MKRSISCSGTPFIISHLFDYVSINILISVHYVYGLSSIDFPINCHIYLYLINRDQIQGFNGGVMTYYRTFPIGNLTLEGHKLGFHKLVFPFSMSHIQGFLSYFVFLLKNKIKISGDSKTFSKIIFFINKEQVWLTSGDAREKCEFIGTIG